MGYITVYFPVENTTFRVYVSEDKTMITSIEVEDYDDVKAFLKEDVLKEIHNEIKRTL